MAAIRGADLNNFREGRAVLYRKKSAVVNGSEESIQVFIGWYRGNEADLQEIIRYLVDHCLARGSLYVSPHDITADFPLYLMGFEGYALVDLTTISLTLSRYQFIVLSEGQVPPDSWSDYRQMWLARRVKLYHSLVVDCQNWSITPFVMGESVISAQARAWVVDAGGSTCVDNVLCLPWLPTGDDLIPIQSAHGEPLLYRWLIPGTEHHLILGMVNERGETRITSLTTI